MKLIGTDREISELHGNEYAVITAWTDTGGSNHYVLQNADGTMYVKTGVFYSQGEVIVMSSAKIKRDKISLINAEEDEWAN